MGKISYNWVRPSGGLRIVFGFSVGLLLSPFNDGWVFVFLWYFFSMLIAQYWYKNIALNASVLIFSLVGYFFGRWLAGLELE